MYPVLRIFNLSIYPYGLMIGIGIVLAVLFFMKRAKRRGYNEEWAFNLAILSIIAGIVGSKVFYMIVELPQYIKDPSLILKDFNSGFVIYGGIIFGILMGYWYSKNRKWSFLAIFDIIAPLLAMAQGFGRIGCMFAGCCYGKETDSFIGVQFNNSPFAPHNVSLIPTQVISSAGDFIIFGILMWFDNKKKTKNGQTGALYLVLYSIGRFIIEIFRGDPRGTVFSIFSTSQFICIFIFIAGMALFYLSAARYKKQAFETEISSANEESGENDGNEGVIASTGDAESNQDTD